MSRASATTKPSPTRPRRSICEDPFRGYYKKLLFNLDGTRLLGGILVGDASDYGTLLALAKSGQLLSRHGELMIGSRHMPAVWGRGPSGHSPDLLLQQRQ